MDLLERIKQKAREGKKTITLPEATDERMLKAAVIIKQEGTADIVLLGDPTKIREKAKANKVDLEGLIIRNPDNCEKTSKYAEVFYEMRKHKGITVESAKRTVTDPLYYAALMVECGDSDGYVAGAVNTTADTFRPALQIIKTAPGIATVSSAFIMVVPECNLGEDGIFIFADCALNPEPTSEQLAEIAVASAKTAESLVGVEPKVAILSFSTKGSAKHPLVDKVTKAVEIAKSTQPELLIDGELQLDAAILSEVGSKKAPDSKIAGKANVLIFPDLQSGNIGYKLVERLAKARAVGPVTQGLAKPVNDLSRGCSVDDIVNVVAITAVQAYS